LAETITNAALRKLDAKARPCVTAQTPLPGGRFNNFETMLRKYQKSWPGIPEIRHLAHMFGSRLPEILNDAKVTDLMPLGESGDTMMQVVHAVRQEMAITLEDVVMRRTCLGQFGPPRQLSRIADVMGAMLGWDEQRRWREVQSLTPLYQTRDAA
jgi:glycerol-3-phosphate dehydrogenase